MSPILVATIAGVITALCWGTGDWLTGKSSKRFDKYAINFAVQLSAPIIMAVILLFAENNKAPTLDQALIILVYSIFITAAYVIFIKALAKGAVGIIVPLANVYPLITLVLSTIFLGSIFTGNQIVAMIAIVLGAVVLAYEKNYKKIPLKTLHRQTALTLFAAVLWGTGFFLIDIVVDDMQWQVLTALVAIFMAIEAGILLALSNKENTFIAMKKSLQNKIPVLAGLVFITGSIAFYYGSDRAGSVIIPAVIASSGPLVASILGALVDKEKVGMIKRMGAIIVVAGIIALNIV